MLMSCSAVLLSNYVCEFFPQQPSQLHTATSRSGGPFIDWGCLCCNFLASVLAGLTYQLSLISPTRVTKNLLALKFVSSFCGSLSVFSGAVSIITVHMYAMIRGCVRVSNDRCDVTPFAHFCSDYGLRVIDGLHFGIFPCSCLLD